MTLTHMPWLIPVLAFTAVFAATLAVAAFTGRDRKQQLRDRMQRIGVNQADGEKAQSLLREQYLRDLNPFELWLESLPGMRRVETLCEQAGRPAPAYRLVLLSLVLALLVGLGFTLAGRPLMGAVLFLLVLPLPYAKLLRDRNQRLQQFEADLPDALDVMSRALRAGNPFNETLKVVSQEMSDPVATELGITFSDINYGLSVKSGFMALLERVPSISLSAMVTAVLVQRETGGNMAEIFDRVAYTLRQRQRFQRRLRTLTAEGRMSAWILVLMPFVLALVLAITSPDYLPLLVDDPAGVRMIVAALVIMSVGVLWIRRVIRVRY
ncbi:secretion system protein [Sinimarinibacterium sp. CAU 1509]|uniref:type II secretion system F family protein n=1 Tax=Sinimarinibacterium sp. CAU 1509 TaxID=2562283 RepID=UPI0010AD3061|nr:type II secretion system F family protein [Sinimarinibacterium sp. CAU 1509]TJY65270.1 secretion system protein [Sinimarinibacterium sp. CAU 1509]